MKAGKKMNDQSNRKKDPLEGVTLKMMLTDVINLFGCKDIYKMTEINSFNDEPPMFNKILKFIRKNPWAIQKIEKMYRGNLETIEKMKRDGTVSKKDLALGSGTGGRKTKF
ncbi:VF530 family DNA-binding protein [Halobacteriovorax sp. DPLXC-1]|uniref:VF530 family DNA-binding protein n=1 Tax=Halobacteriovorax sp. DPLXC-1 TaxID=3110771 RepID=UPI002FEF83E4